MNKYVGETFLSKLYRDMHISSEVIKSSDNNDNKYEKIRKYLLRLENIHNELLDKDRLGLIKKFYYDKYVIKKENINDEYFEHLEENSFNRGFGRIHYNNYIRNNESEAIINDQKKSLDVWIDYFVSKDSDMFPIWFKYYVFQNIVKLGSYDKNKNSFNQRTEYTVSTFPDLNREALAIMYDYFVKYLKGEKDLEDSVLEKLIKSNSFKKIYAYLLKKISLEKRNVNITEGKWVKYDKGSDHMVLVNGIIGKGTGWCTAGESTAKNQLSTGDFYVYYSYDDNNMPTIPRIAIRMEDDKIAEVRGIEKDQNIEECMENIVEEKLNDFPDKYEYLKKANDMKKLTSIYYKQSKSFELDKEELKFLYELENKIEGFGYQEDPRIEELLSQRNLIQDLSIMFDCKSNNIIDKKELINKDTYVLNNTFVSDVDNLDGVLLPKYLVMGDIILDKLRYISDFNFPMYVRGNFSIIKVNSVNNAIFPTYIFNDFDMRSIKDLNNIKFGNYVGGNIFLNNLSNTNNVILPNYVGQDLIMRDLVRCENLVFPKIVRGNINLDSLENLENVVLPSYIGGYLNLSSLKGVDNLILPDNFDLSKLIIRDDLRNELINKNKKL